MNVLSRRFFQSDKNFKEHRILSDEPDLSWDDVASLGSDLPRGWFELSRLTPSDRIHFISEFWLTTLPYHPLAHPIFTEFFGSLDDIAVILRKQTADDIFSSELVYSLADESTFFRGLPPAQEKEVLDLKREIGSIFPRDFLAFLRIHNGFGKLSEMGLLRVDEIPDARRRVIDLMLKGDRDVKSGEEIVDAGALIPFFEVLGLSSFQCFYSDWYPGSEMGNVYLSGVDYTISDVSAKKDWGENLAFPTFSEWLAEYLEGMNLSP